MAKKAAKTSKTRSESIPAAKFVEEYSRLAAEGKSADEIGKVLNRPGKSVSVRASQLRKHIKEAKCSDELKAQLLAKLPVLSPVRNVIKSLEELL